MSEFAAGQRYEVKFPFVGSTYEAFDWDGPYSEECWKPGVEFKNVGPEDVEAVALAEGMMVLEVVGTFKPGRYPERVFYTRRWIDPEGKGFGSNQLKMCTVEKFRRISRGYAYPYRLEEGQ